ncbi:MAG: GspH/FimT family pseudopilin [Gammaproteobacteria bacterium]
MSLWELLWIVTITSSVIAWGAPGFDGFLLDARRTADVNAFVLAIQLARSEAAKRGRAVVLCKSDDRRRCGDGDIGFDAGWMVFVDTDDSAAPQRSESDELLLFHEPRSAGPIRANRRLFAFRPFGWRSTNGTITFCDRRGASRARAIIVSYTGRPRVADTGPGGRVLGCGDS